MTEKFNDATINRPEGERPLDAPIIRIDLHELIQQIKDEKAWKKNDRNAITVFKTAGMTIVLVALHEDASVNPHSIEGITSIQLLEGRLQILNSGEAMDVKEGQIITVKAKIDHTIIAIKKSIFLLTVAGNYGNGVDV